MVNKLAITEASIIDSKGMSHVTLESWGRLCKSHYSRGLCIYILFLRNYQRNLTITILY